MLYQTLQTILACRNIFNKTRHSVGWEKRHIWLFWVNWKEAFIHLGMMCAEEANLRDIPYDREKADRFFLTKCNKPWRKPYWVGWERLHSDHRAALLQYEEIRRLHLRIIKWKKLENLSKNDQEEFVNNWFNEQGFIRSSSNGDPEYNMEVNTFLTRRNIPMLSDEYPKHYTQFNWIEEPCGSISAWPLEPEESWLCEA